MSGNSYWRGRVSKINLLVKTSCFVKKISNTISWFEIASARSTVLIPTWVRIPCKYPRRDTFLQGVLSIDLFTGPCQWTFFANHQEVLTQQISGHCCAALFLKLVVVFKKSHSRKAGHQPHNKGLLSSKGYLKKTLKERAVDLDLLKEVNDAIDKMASWGNELAPKWLLHCRCALNQDRSI